MKKISFATFNLLNLQLPNKPIYDNKDGWSQEQYDKKIKWSSNVIKVLDTDVWGFQELWAKDSIKEVFESAGKLTDYDLLVPPTHNGKSIVCGAAVRKGLIVGEPEWLSKFPEKMVLRSGGDDAQSSKISVNLKTFSRPVLRFKIKVKDNTEPISVYVTHLKSRVPAKVYYENWYNDDKNFYSKHSNGIGAALSTIRRSAEAAALRMYMTEELKGTEKPLVILGDFNDGQLSNTLNIITEQPTYLMSGSSGGSDNALYTTGTLQEYRSLRDVYYTHSFKKIKESLDHILVSQEFYDNSKKRVWAFDGMLVYNDHLNSEEHKNDGTSDHGIVKATFKHNPF